jgi:hypothetical protein
MAAIAEKSAVNRSDAAAATRVTRDTDRAPFSRARPTVDRRRRGSSDVLVCICQ